MTQGEQQPFKEWEELFQETSFALEKVVGYIQAVQPREVEPTPLVRQFAEKFSTDELQEYLSRGCRPKMDLYGWHKAGEAQKALQRLGEIQRRFQSILHELQSLISTTVEGQVATMNESWMSQDSEEEISWTDTAFLVATKIHELEKEMNLLGLIVNDISVFSRISTLTTYLTLWKLRPYASGELAVWLQRLDAAWLQRVVEIRMMNKRL